MRALMNIVKIRSESASERETISVNHSDREGTGPDGGIADSDFGKFVVD